MGKKKNRFKFVETENSAEETVFETVDLDNIEEKDSNPINKIEAPDVVKEDNKEEITEKFIFEDEQEEVKEEIAEVDLEPEIEEEITIETETSEEEPVEEEVEIHEEEEPEEETHEEKIEEEKEEVSEEEQEEPEEEVTSGEETKEDEEQEEITEESEENDNEEEQVEPETEASEETEEEEETTEKEPEEETEEVEQETEAKKAAKLDELMKTHELDAVETTSTEKEKTLPGKRYISFEARVALLVIFIIATLSVSIFLYMLSFNFGRKDLTRYNETTTVNYKVCPKDNPELCIDENLKYSSENIDNVDIDLTYDREYTNGVDYEMTYHVVATTKVYDKSDNNKMLYESEDMLVNKTKIENKDKTSKFSQNIKLDYKKYNDYIYKYIDNSSLDPEALVELKLYINEPNQTREVASLNIPLGELLFGIKKHEITNKNKLLKLEENIWTEKNTVYIICATVLLIIALFLIFKLTNMILKVINHKNEFETAVKAILREYDRIIVVARGGYETNVEKRIIKVLDFDELLEARSALNKPIVYSKINNVKCEFIVEDEQILYKYVMKEADF